MGNTSIKRIAALASLAALAAGCASPDGLAPHARLLQADRLQAGATLAQARLTPAAWPAPDWWRRYGDPQLDRLHFSENSNVPKPLAGAWKWSDEASLNAGYELDFWGKNQAALDAALGRERAAVVDVAAARLLLTVGVVQTYLTLSQLHAQRDLGLEVFEQRRRILALTAQRVAAKIDSEAERSQAELAVTAAQAEIAAVDEAIALAQTRLAALLGAGPDRGALIARPQLQSVRPAGVPATLPSELLARRPDLVAQRWRVESLASEIEAAMAQFYPSFNLNALVGLQSLGFGAFLQGGSMIAAAGAGLSLPVFDGGRLRGNLALRHADYDLAVEAYNLTLVDALRDVASQLVAIDALGKRQALQAQATASAQRAYELSLRRYRAGVGNYLQVLSAQLQLQQQRRLQIDLDTRAFELDMQLARALGGGYAGQSQASTQ